MFELVATESKRGMFLLFAFLIGTLWRGSEW